MTMRVKVRVKLRVRVKIRVRVRFIRKLRIVYFNLPEKILVPRY